MNYKYEVDVLVIGDNVSGLSSLYNLQKEFSNSNKLKYLLVKTPQDKYANLYQDGFSLAGHLENYTRINHLLGDSKAKEYWEFGLKAYRSLLELARILGINYSVGERLRFITSEHEFQEAQLAVKLLNRDNFKTTLIKSDSKVLNHYQITNNILAIQNEGLSTAYLDYELFNQALLQKVRNKQTIYTNQDLTKIIPSANGVEFYLSDGSIGKAEICISTMHLHILNLLENYTDKLIPICDQWQDVLFTNSFDSIKAGSFITLNNTYEWLGVLASNNKASFRIGGARYLRKNSGIGEVSNDVFVKSLEKTASVIKKSFSKKFTTTDNIKVFNKCQPCDELPLIGPDIVHERVMLATGFNGNGLALGTLAGKCLADLICHSRSSDLPGFLWPKRLRSLSD